MRDRLIEHGIQATAQLFGGLPLETVLDQIVRLDPAMIIMGSHGHGALYYLIAGSVTEGVIRHASRPVLVIPSVAVPETHLVRMAARKSQQVKTGLLAGIPIPV